MVRIVLGVIAGFFAWAIAWVGSEKLLSAIWPDWFGAHQRAFQAALENGGQFTADTTILLMHMDETRKAHQTTIAVFRVISCKFVDRFFGRMTKRSTKPTKHDWTISQPW